MILGVGLLNVPTAANSGWFAGNPSYWGWSILLTVEGGYGNKKATANSGFDLKRITT